MVSKFSTMKLSGSFFTGTVLALLGALLFSTKAIFVKLAYHYDVDSSTLLLFRMLMALPFYVYMIYRDYGRSAQQWKMIKPRYWWALVASSFLGYYLSSLLDFMGLQYIDASIERLILFIYPTIIALLSFIVFRERLRKLQTFALIVSYLGLVFVFGEHLSHISLSQTFWKGAILIFLCAITFAVFLVINQWVIPQFGARSFTSLSMTLACFFVIIHFLLEHHNHIKWPEAWQVYLYSLAMATLATIIPSYFVNTAIQQIGATRVGILSSVGPISTISLAYWLLDERLSSSQIIGAFFIIVGVSFVSFDLKRRASNKT